MNFVLKTSPAHTSGKVPFDATLEVHFMIDINMHSIEGNVILFNVDEQRSEAVDVEYKNRILLIRPRSHMQPLAHYQVQLVGGKEGITDITGRNMDETYTFEFYSDDVQGIKPPLLLTPSDQSEIRSDIKFTWEPAENAYYYELEISKSNTFDVLVWPKERQRIFEREIMPDIAYSNGNYYARIRSVKSDGTRSAYSKPIQFYYNGVNEQVQQQPAQQNDAAQSELESLQQIFADQSPVQNGLSVVSMSPLSDSLHLPVAQISEIVIEFSEDVDPACLRSEWFYVVAERN